MTLRNVDSVFEIKRVIKYDAKGTKAVYSNQPLQKVVGGIYKGKAMCYDPDDWCDIYVCYDDVPIGMWIGSMRLDVEVDKVLEAARTEQIDTLDNYKAGIQRRLARQDHFKWPEIEFAKYICPELQSQMVESKKAYKEIREKAWQAEREKREAEERAFVQQKNAETEAVIAKALEIIRNDGTLKNDDITFYTSRYSGNSYSVVNYLMRQYNVNVPLRTQGWINSKLSEAKICNGACESLRYFKKKGSSCSQKFFECMNDLITAVRNSDAA